MDNNLEKFTEKNLAIFESIAEIEKEIKEKEKLKAKYKEEIQRGMEEYGIVKMDNDILSLSYVQASTSVSLDTKALKKLEPELFEELMADYPKTTTKKPYVRITIKK